MKKIRSALAFMIWLGAIEVSEARAVQAADVSSDCCTDLETRIVELEAAAVQKGTRKVSLTISGFVAQEITWWDDGGERNVYLHGLGPTQASHVKFTGEAKVAPG